MAASSSKAQAQRAATLLLWSVLPNLVTNVPLTVPACVLHSQGLPASRLHPTAAVQHGKC
jgi:hypothetical protein